MKLRLPTLLAALLSLCVPTGCTDSKASVQPAPPPMVKPLGPKLFRVAVNEKDGFINEKGQLVIPAIYQKAYPFSDGLAVVQQDGLWGFIDTAGRMVIQPRFLYAGFFSDGLAPVQQKRFSDSLGYINKKGEWVWKPRE